MGDIVTLLSYGDAGWSDELLAGAWLTISLALATLPFGLVVALLVALAKDSGEPSLALAANIYTTIFRGLPELLTLLIVYYGGQIVVQMVIGLFTDTYVELNGFVAGMVALGAVFSAFASEVFLSALRGIPSGQYEAAWALGLSRARTFMLIILPQLVRLSLAGLSNLWLVMLKGTALVSVIALDDLLREASIAVGATKQPLFFYSVALLIYLVLSLISGKGIHMIETRVNRGQHR